MVRYEQKYLIGNAKYTFHIGIVIFDNEIYYSNKCRIIILSKY